METDIWGQLALEASQVYLENGNSDNSKSNSSSKTVNSHLFLYFIFFRPLSENSVREKLSNDVITTIIVAKSI